MGSAARRLPDFLSVGPNAGPPQPHEFVGYFGVLWANCCFQPAHGGHNFRTSDVRVIKQNRENNINVGIHRTAPALLREEADGADSTLNIQVNPHFGILPRVVVITVAVMAEV